MILFSFSFVVAVVGTWRFKTKTKDEFFLIEMNRFTS